MFTRHICGIVFPIILTLLITSNVFPANEQIEGASRFIVNRAKQELVYSYVCMLKKRECMDLFPQTKTFLNDNEILSLREFNTVLKETLRKDVAVIVQTYTMKWLNKYLEENDVHIDAVKSEIEKCANDLRIDVMCKKIDSITLPTLNYAIRNYNNNINNNIIDNIEAIEGRLNNLDEQVDEKLIELKNAVRHAQEILNKIKKITEIKKITKENISKLITKKIISIILTNLLLNDILSRSNDEKKNRIKTILAHSITIGVISESSVENIDTIISKIQNVNNSIDTMDCPIRIKKENSNIYITDELQSSAKESLKVIQKELINDIKQQSIAILQSNASDSAVLIQNIKARSYARADHYSEMLYEYCENTYQEELAKNIKAQYYLSEHLKKIKSGYYNYIDSVCNSLAYLKNECYLQLLLKTINSTFGQYSETGNTNFLNCAVSCNKSRSEQLQQIDTAINNLNNNISSDVKTNMSRAIRLVTSLDDELSQPNINYRNVMRTVCSVMELRNDIGGTETAGGSESDSLDLLQTGFLFADIADAETPEAVEAVLENAAVPVSGYLLKRKVSMAIYLNAYVGGALFIGKYKRGGFFMPVGIDWKIGNRFCGSHSIFLSPINLGNYV